jgi:hypothetical protein
MPGDAGLLQLELYALCRDGRVAEAESVARAALGRRIESRKWVALVEWLGERFGFAPGS